MAKRTIAVVTSTRAEYGLFYPVLKEIQADPDLDLKLLVTGTHVQEKFGYTAKEIEADGFEFTTTEDFFSDSDGAEDVVQNFGQSSVEVSKYLAQAKPDILLVLGDRYEMLAFAVAGLLMHVPVAHIAGGEITSGALDDSIRHAITKLSSIHFPATDLYAKRILQMGESPDHVHVVGSTGVENTLNIELLAREDLEQAIGYNFGEKTLLATFHPVTTDSGSSKAQLEELFKALDQHSDVHVLFTMPNADEGGLELLQAIEAYAAQNEGRISFVQSLGFKNYLSSLRFVDGVIGNSSSGIIEAPSFKIGTINIGTRQDGRTRAESVIDCDPDAANISEAITQLYSDQFQAVLKTVENPFFKEGSSKAIKNVIKTADLKNLQYKVFKDMDLVA